MGQCTRFFVLVAALLLTTCVKLPVQAAMSASQLPTQARGGPGWLLHLPVVLQRDLPAGQDAVLVGAGDVAICGRTGAEATSSLLAELPEAAIFLAGDGSNQDGTLDWNSIKRALTLPGDDLNPASILYRATMIMQPRQRQAISVILAWQLATRSRGFTVMNWGRGTSSP